MTNNVSNTFSKFLKLINAKVTTTSSLKYLESHPDYPSMFAYSEALNYWNIENVSLKLTAEEYAEVPTPHITFFQRHHGTFVLVKKIKDNAIEWHDSDSGWQTQPIEEFTKNWSGVVMFAETNEKSGESQYTQKRYNELLNNSRIPLAVFFTVGLLAGGMYYVNFPFTPINTLLLVCKTIGVTISTLLLIKSIDSQNDLINKLCNIGKKVSCQSILDSKAARLTSWLSLSDAGFIYFFGTLSGLLLSNNTPVTFLSTQLFLSGIGVLFSFYSIYYQGFIAKIWCPLCIGTISIFWVEFVSLIFFFNYNPSLVLNFTGSFINIIVISVLVPVIFLLLYKKTSSDAAGKQKLEVELQKLKRNPAIFEALASKNSEMLPLHQGMGVVTIGNREAQNTITFVSNPLCSPCAKMHERIEKVLHESNNLKCELVFLTNPNDIDVGGRLVRKIFSLPNHLQQKAIAEWFGRNDRNFDKWNLPYKDFPESKISAFWQKEHNEWSIEANVRVTPTIFFNGILLPDIYSVEDLILK